MNKLKSFFMWFVMVGIIALLVINLFLFISIDQRSINNQRNVADSERELDDFEEDVELRLSNIEQSIAGMANTTVINGKDGSDGKDGKDGVGIAGADGVDGAKGDTGDKGKDGKDAPILEIRCNETDNWWESRYYVDGIYTEWQILNDTITECTIE